MREFGLTLLYRWLILLRFVAWRVLRPRAIGVRVVVRRGDEFLLVHHRGGAAPWGLPGGALIEERRRLMRPVVKCWRRVVAR